MSLKLDDLIGKKKEVVQILDLSKATANNAEEFKKIMEKVPDFKVKPEKVKPEDVKIQDRPKRWNKKPKKTPYPFADPIPVEMRSLKLEDLCSVPIQWNMLTTLRPKSKLDEEYFSRLVELGKLALATQEEEKKVPITDLIKKMKNRAGVTETRFVSCAECGENFCLGETCTQLSYENFKRQPIPDALGKKEKEPRGRTKKKRHFKSKSRKTRSRARSKTRRDSKDGSTSGDRSTSRSKSRGRSKSGGRSKSTGRSKSRGRSKGEGKPGEEAGESSRTKSKNRSKTTGRGKDQAGTTGQSNKSRNAKSKTRKATKSESRKPKK